MIVADGVREREDALRRQSQLAATAASLGRQLDDSGFAPPTPRPPWPPRPQKLSEARKSLGEAPHHPLRGHGRRGLRPPGPGHRPPQWHLRGQPLRRGRHPQPDYLNLYKSAAGACPGLSWTVLAAVGSTRSTHGRTAAPGVRDGANFAGAMGPMQFLAPTWAAYGLDGGGDGIADVYDPADAVFGASNYLCANGAGDPARLAGAIWAYNHADWYVRGVLDLAIRYGAAGLHASSADAASLLANPNLTIGPQAAADLAAGPTGPVTVVNETLVNTFWKNRNPIGQRLRPCCGDAVPWFTVIGVAKDVKQGGIDRETGTEFYRLIEQTAGLPPPAVYAPNAMNVVLRTTLPPSALSQTITTAVREVDRSVPVVRLREMDDVFAESIQRPRLLAQLLGGFAGLALLLAALGTYGVLAGMVAERRRGIGIRMALGANRSRVVGDVMSHGLLLTGIGLIADLAGALALTRLMASLLFGVRPTDPLTIATVVTTIAVVAALACGLPAWRASRVDPIVVLRDE